MFCRFKGAIRRFLWRFVADKTKAQLLNTAHFAPTAAMRDFSPFFKRVYTFLCIRVAKNVSNEIMLEHTSRDTALRLRKLLSAKPRTPSFTDYVFQTIL